MENEIIKEQSEKSNQPVSKDPIELVKEVQKELSEYRKPFEKYWREYDNAYYGKQHKTGENKKSVKNHVFKIIEGEVPILTDSMPGTQITANTEDRQQDADDLNKAIRYVYQDQNIPLILPTLVRSSLISAPGYLYAFYNPDAEMGEGKIEYRQLPWESVFLDGNAQTIEQAEKCRIEIPMRRDAIARMWPEKSKQILETNPKSENISFGDNDNLEQRDVSGGNDEMGKPQRYKAKDIVKYVETWIKSYDLENIEPEETQKQLTEENAQLLNGEAPDIGKWEDHNAHEMSHKETRAQVLGKIGLAGDAPFEDVSKAIEGLLQNNPEAQDLSKILMIVKIIDNHLEEHEEMKKINPTGQEPKYEDGWRLIKSVENVILYDGENPEENGHIPLVPFYCYKDDTIYGFSEVKNIIDPQRTLNDMDQRELEGLRLNSNPGWIVDHEAEVDENELTNEPGIVVKKKRGTEVTRFPPGQVSPQLAQRKEMDESAMEQISGLNEATQGQLPSSGASGVTVQKLQTQAIGRIRLKDRYLQHYSMRRLAIITASLILNHWTTEKRFRLRSDETSIEEVVFNPLKMHDLGYTVEISQGSMAGIDKDALNALYLQYYQVSQGAMTFEDLLTVSDFPKKEILLNRIKDRNQEQQTLQQLQEQIAQLQQQNNSLLGLANPQILDGNQKKLFDLASKQALAEKMISEASAQMPQENNANDGANNGQPDMQGMM
ncbi:MAG: hypothetical protein AB7I27_00405 [Bacteriovoracaceae bacterium]